MEESQSESHSRHASFAMANSRMLVSLVPRYILLVFLGMRATWEVARENYSFVLPHLVFS